MASPSLVLVHGGEHAADCWDLTVTELHRQAPDLSVLAVDLPGRGSRPGDLATATIDQWVASAVADIESAGFGDVVVVGHSMAGVTVPGIVARLGAPRVREMILATAFVPREGEAIVDTLDGPLAWFAQRAVRGGKSVQVPAFVNRYAFCNGMTRDQRRFAMSRLYPESVRVVGERVSRRDLPPDVPRTWILTTRDRALSVGSQQRSIDAIGGVQHMISIDACHDVMISKPVQLAQILIDRCRSYA